MPRVDPSALPGAARPAGDREEIDCVPEEAAAKNVGARPPVRSGQSFPILAGLGPASRVTGVSSNGLPPILLGAGLLPSWIEMYRMLLQLEMSEAMRSVLHPDPPPPGRNDPPEGRKSRISEHYEIRRARQIAERRAANNKNRDGKID